MHILKHLALLIMISRVMASFVFSILIITVVVTGSKFSDTEIDQLLKKLNKPAIKSIKSPDGDIIDCVDINKQPAFDHPLLRNHTIKMRPSIYPEGWNKVSLKNEKQSSMVTQLWTTKGRCPKNTVPIRRTRREDILRAESIERFGKKNPNMIHDPSKPATPSARNALNGTHSYAILAAMNGKFHGAKADINLWKPYLQKRQEFSLAQIWINAGTHGTDLNTIEAGWQIYPGIYGDFNTRFFIFWTRDAYKSTGCYNLLCGGFVQISPVMIPGAVLNPTSIYAGEQRDFIVYVWKDFHSGAWWLGINNNIVVGYWAASCFTHLQNGATGVMWGGEVIDEKTGDRHTTTQMGSGHFPQEGYTKASYFKNVQILDETNNLRPVPAQHQTSVTEAHCYNIKLGQDSSWGSYFFYGGPGRNRMCP